MCGEGHDDATRLLQPTNFEESLVTERLWLVMQPPQNQAPQMQLFSDLTHQGLTNSFTDDCKHTTRRVNKGKTWIVKSHDFPGAWNVLSKEALAKKDVFDGIHCLCGNWFSSQMNVMNSTDSAFFWKQLVHQKRGQIACFAFASSFLSRCVTCFSS